MSVFLWPGRLPPIGPPSNTTDTLREPHIPQGRFAWRVRSRFDGACPSSPAAVVPEAREECWHVYYDDAHVGSIAIRSGNPHDEDPWEWHCGFYPGSEPGEQQNGTAATFDEARTDFERAWRVFLSRRTEADFQAWRDQRDWTARKYAMWEAR